MARLGCLLQIFSMVALCVLVGLPVLPFTADNAMLDSVLQPLLCGAGETLRRDQYSTSYRPGEVRFSMEVYCVDGDNRERDATGQWIGLSIIAFTAPFMIGILLFIFGLFRTARRSADRLTAGLSQGLGAAGLNASPAQGIVGAANNPTLTQRLKELQEARDAGLITEDEFQQKRRELVDRLA